MWKSLIFRGWSHYYLLCVRVLLAKQKLVFIFSSVMWMLPVRSQIESETKKKLKQSSYNDIALKCLQFKRLVHLWLFFAVVTFAAYSWSAGSQWRFGFNEMHLNNFIDRIISISVTKRNVGKFVRPSRCNVIQNWLRLRNPTIVRKILMHVCMRVNAHVISLIWSCWSALARTRAETHTHTRARDYWKPIT